MTDEYEEAFQRGVTYERTRIMENLMLMLPDAEELDALGQMVALTGVMPMVPLSDIIQWACDILEHPVHTVAESVRSTDNALEIMRREQQ